MTSRVELLKALGHADPDVRLAAARDLVRVAEPDDAEALRQALAVETVYWVRRALTEAISNASGKEPEPVDAEVEGKDELGDRLAEESYARALEDITSELAHELSPLIGAVDYFAALETENYEGSRTAGSVVRLRGALDAIRALGSAATAPTFSEFAIAQAIRDVAEAERRPGALLSYSGPDDLLVEGDKNLVGLAISNGLRNAVEATQQAEGAKPVDSAIVIAWDETDVDYWVTILDEGPGLPSSYTRAFELGVTNKPEHLGMGLAIAQRAAQSLNGKVSLRGGREGGALFELRWPRRGAGLGS